MKKEFNFWWWVGHRVIWGWISLIPALIIRPGVVTEVKYFFSASQASGKILGAGMVQEVIGGGGVGGTGTWTKTIYSPYVDVQIPDNSSGTSTRSCRIEGQLGVFGDWLSDDEMRVQQELDKIIRDGYLKYYILTLDRSSMPLCRVNHVVDSYAIAIFIASICIFIFFAIWSFRSYGKPPIDDDDNLFGEKKNDI